MYLHVNQKEAELWNLINLDKGDIMTHVKWADDQKGEYGVGKKRNGKYCFDQKGKLIIEVKKGNIKLVKKEK